MQKQIKALVDAILRAKQQHKRWLNVVTGMMAVVVFVTTYALILPAITMTADAKELVCPIEVHQHTSECYDGTGALICGQTDYIVHTHDSNCYDSEGRLICTMPEVEEHIHSDECYGTILTCTETDVTGHTHDDSCYTQRLNCGYPEEEHTHSTDCYDENGELSCGLEEHTHVDECYVSILSCDTEETEGHTHDENCFASVLTCGKNQIEVHSHGTNCYKTIVAEDGTEQKVLTCDKPVVYRHQHGDGCFQAATAEETEKPTESAEPTETATPEESAEPEETAAPEDETEKTEVTSKLKAAVMKAASSATANQWTDDISWYIEDGTLYIEGTGDMPEVKARKAPWYSSRSSIKNVVISEGITSVGAYDFYYMSYVKSVELPSTLKSIGNYGFYYCFSSSSISGETTLNLPEGLESIGIFAFASAVRLTSAVLPSTLTSIGDCAFMNCSKAVITLSDTPITVGESSFYNCPNLQGTAVLAEGMTQVPSAAFSGCKNLNGVVIPSTVSSIGDKAFYQNTSLTEVTLPEGVTSIGTSAFQGCTGLTKLQLPTSLQTIGESAFESCTALAELNTEGLSGLTSLGSSAFKYCSALAIDLVLPEGISEVPDFAFSGCSSLKSVTLHEGVTSIGTTAFSNCTGLTEISIPDSVTTINDYAFGGCKGITQVTLSKNLEYFSGFNNTGITEIEIPDTVTAIGNSALSQTGVSQVNIPDGVTTIGKKAFYSTNISEISLPEGLTQIGESAFESTNLTQLDIPDSVSSIGSYFIRKTQIDSIKLPSALKVIEEYTFAESNVSSVEIPDGITSIGKYAFYTTKIKEISIPDSVTEMGDHVFYQCSELESAKLSKNITSIGEYSFYKCSKLKSVIMPEKVTEIGNYAFYQCEQLNDIDLSEGLTQIGNYAFCNCYNLRGIKLPKTLTYIGGSAFQYCSKINSIDLPEGLTIIGSYAFERTGIKSVTIPSTLEKLNQQAFANCNDLTEVIFNGDTWMSNAGDYTRIFYSDYKIGKVVLNTAAMEKLSGCFDDSSIRGDIVVGKNVETLYKDTVFYLLSKRANDSVGLSFEGPNSFYYSGATAEENEEAGYYDINFIEGSYYADENGVLYRLNEDNTATLVYCPAELKLDDYSSLLKSFTTEDGTSYNVTAIDGYAFEGNTSITSIAIPSNISSIGKGAFYNCSKLGSVNGETSLEAVETALGSISLESSSFWNTALTGSEEEITEDNENYDINYKTIELDKNESDNSYKLKVSFDYANLMDGTENQQLTGFNTFISVALDDTNSGVKDNLRVYFQAGSDCSLRNKSNGTILGYKQDTEILFTTNSGESVSCYFRVADEEKGLYYVDLGSIKQGDTVRMDFSCTYPNKTKGGTVTAWIDNSEGEAEPEEVLQAKWVTEPDEYKFTFTQVRNAKIETDGTENGAAYLNNYYATLSINETAPSYGANYIKSVDCKFWMDLPEGIYWNEKIVDAIKNDRVNIYRDYQGIYHFEADLDNDGNYTEFGLIRGNEREVVSMLADMTISLDENDNVIFNWVQNNPDSGKISDRKVQIYFNYPNVLMLDRDVLAEEVRNGDITKTIVSNVEGSATYRFGDEKVEKSTGSKMNLTISGGTYTLEKEPAGGEYRFGGDILFNINVINKSIFPAYYDKVVDELNYYTFYYYVKAENIEKMMKEEDGKYLSFYIENAKICKEDSRSTTTKVTDINGDEQLVDPQLVGTDPTYSVGLLTDNCVEDTLDMEVKWNSDGSLIEIITTNKSGTSNTYTVGQGGDYDSVEATFKDLGIQIQNDTAYFMTWQYPESYKLNNSTTKTYNVYATVKTTAMLMTSDKERIFSTGGSTGLQNQAYVYTGTTVTTPDYIKYPNISLDEYTIYKTGRTNGQTVTASTELKVSDVISYTNYVTNHAAVQGLPMVDKMSGAQLLLAPVADNPELKGKGLATVTDGGIEYYKLTEGTYSNLKVAIYTDADQEPRTIVADSVTVKATGSGYETLIYWYLTLDTVHPYASSYGYGTDDTHKFTYKAIVEINNSGSSDDINFPVNNEVWLGDHQGHRLYDYVGYYSVTLSVNKYIVTNAETPISADHDSEQDELVTSSNIKAGETVTYRLMVNVIADKEGNSSTLNISGASIFDDLPKSYNNYWSKDNVTVTYVAKDGSIFEPSDSSTDAWSISTVTKNTKKITQQRLVWNSDFKLKAKGTGYIYVTLKYPDKDSADWTKLATEVGSDILYNKWQVGSAYAQVEHRLAVETVALLQKGVYGTGIEINDYSYYAVSYNNRENGREYFGDNNYTNNNNKGSVVVYYVALYNEGNTRLYINDIQDVLPKGFSFEGLMYDEGRVSTSSNYDRLAQQSNANYSNNGNGLYKNRFFKIMSEDYSEDLTPTSSYSARGFFKPSVETLADGRERVTISLVNNSSYSSATFGYDSDLGKYYLNPDQYMVIMYCCKINASVKTEALATNSVSMPFEDYNGGGVVVDDSKVFTPAHYTTVGNSLTKVELKDQDPNDGSIELLNKEEASSLGMNVGRTNYNQWLTSQVSMSKGIMKPGISKECTVTQALSTDTLNWNIYVTGGDEGNLTSYTITDTVMEPYKFTDYIEYYIDFGDSTVTIDSNLSKSLMNMKIAENIPAVGQEKKFEYSDDSYYTLRLDEDEETGTQTLTLKLVGERYELPIGIKGKLTVRTINTSGKYENKDYINTAYLTPEEDFDRIDISYGAYTEYDPALDGVDKAMPSVTAEARVPVSYGYATTSNITITELGNTDNTGASNSEANKIAVGATDSLFRYEMNVTNSGSANSPATAMSLFVLVDNLPEVGDHQTFYDKFGRYSEFKVDFADNEEDLDLQVYVTDENNNVKVLDPSQYEVMFTKQTSFEYNDNKDVWKGEDLSDNENWYTLEECLADGTLSDMRSFRVVLRDENAESSDSTVEKLIPAKSKVSVAFNAKIDEDSDIDVNQIAYNSFGYLYMVNNGQLQSSTASVGVKTPGVPYIVKKLVGTSGETYKARQDESFQVIIYKGTSQGFDAGLSTDEIFEKLDALNIDATMVTLDVPEGKSASETLELSNLKCYVYDEDSKSWVPGTKTFTWDDGKKYTARELPIDEDSEFEFASVNASQKNSYSFGFLNASPNTVTFTNKKQSGAIKLTKVGDRNDAVLSKALFGLYTTNKEDALDEDETLTDIDKAEREIKVDDTTWYLKDLQRSDENGLIQWSGLMEDQYYVLELEAPESYAIGDEPGQVVDIEFGTTKEITVTNYWSYYLPRTGGTGTLQYTLAGTALTIASAGALLYLKKKKEEQG